MSEDTVNVGLLVKMLAGSPRDVDVYATTSALVLERLLVVGVAHVDLPDGTKACVLILKQGEPLARAP